MAELLLARATGMSSFERHVVIKRIHAAHAGDERLVQMFLDEARLAASLHHQNIVQVYDVGEQGGQYFFAMEYVHGEDLRKVHAKLKDSPMPLAIVVSIVSAAAAGLHHAHEQRGPGPERAPLGLVHRDVSLGNILVGYDGSVKLVDFGLARAAMRSVKTRTGTLKGKAEYMSPEQCMGKELDRRSDVFALGIVLYELATGRRLFKAANDYLSMTAIVGGEIPKPSTHRADIPPALDEIIMRALARAPEARFPSAEAMREALEQFAVSAELRVSTKALADYMHGLFGDRLEPWRSDVAAPAVDEETTEALPGIVEPPATPEIITHPLDRNSAPIAIALATTVTDVEIENEDDEDDEDEDDDEDGDDDDEDGDEEDDDEEDDDGAFVEESATVASAPPEFTHVDDPGQAPTVVGGPLVDVDEVSTTTTTTVVPPLPTGSVPTVPVPIKAVPAPPPPPRPLLPAKPAQQPPPSEPAAAGYDDSLIVPRRPRTDEARTAVAPSRSQLEAMYVGPPAPRRWIVLAQRYRLVVIAGAAALVLAIALIVMLVSRSSSSTAASDAPTSSLPDAGVSDAANKTSPKTTHPATKHR